MNMVVATQLSEQEILALPDEPGKRELLDGELIAMPPADQDHNDIIKRLFKQLDATSHGSRVFFEAGFKLRTGRWLQPDISVIWPDQPRGRWFERAPMIAIEVISSGNSDEEIDRKVLAFLDDGAAEVWIVRPRTESLTVYRNETVGGKTRGVSVRYSDAYTPAKELLGENVAIDIQKVIHGQQ
jgi:Uma2 family endonuclease